MALIRVLESNIRDYFGPPYGKYGRHGSTEGCLSLVTRTLAAPPLVLAQLAGSVGGIRLFSQPVEQEPGSRAPPAHDAEADGQEVRVAIIFVATFGAPNISIRNGPRGRRLQLELQTL